MNRLREIRKQAGLSQQQVADAAGLLRQSVQQYETDAREPGIRQAVRIARALGVRVDDIWTIDDDRSAA